MWIRVIGAAGNQWYAHIGDVIAAVIKYALPQMPLERSEVIRDVIEGTCKEFKCLLRNFIPEFVIMHPLGLD
jgi:large subunit ribosomal protein L14